MLVVAFLCGFALVIGAPAAHATFTGPVPAGITCRSSVAGRALAVAGGAVVAELGNIQVVQCKYGRGHEIDLRLEYALPISTSRPGCQNTPETDTKGGGDGYDPLTGLGLRWTGIVLNFDHAVDVQWDVVHQGDFQAARTAELDLAQQASRLAPLCSAAKTAPGPASTSHSSGSTPAGIGLVGGGLLLAVGGLLVGRGAGASPPLALEDRVIDGPEAINVLQRAGLLESVTRPDGTSAYRPTGMLAQFDKLPQERVALTNQGVVNGEQFHDVGALAYNEHPDGTFDSATIVVGVKPASPPVLAPATPTPPGEPLADHLARQLFTEHLFDETGSALPEDAADQLLDGNQPKPPAPTLPPEPPRHPTPPTPPSPPPIDPARYHRAELRRNEGQDEASVQNRIARRAGMLESVYSGLGWFADRAMDVLGKMTGPCGKTVKDVYTVSKGIGKGVGESITDLDKGHILKGAAEGGFDLLWGRAVDKLPSIGAKGAGSGAGGATKLVRTIAPDANPTSIVKRPLTPPEALKAGFSSWVQKTVVRNPVKKLIGF